MEKKQTKKKNASLYLLPTVALVQEGPRPKPLLLHLFDGRLKLVASGGRGVNLLGGRCWQQAVRTLRLALEGIVSVFLGSVDGKADMNLADWGTYSHASVQDEICIDLSANLEDLGPSLCSHDAGLLLSWYEWMSLFVRWYLCSLLTLKSFYPPKLSR